MNANDGTPEKSGQPEGEHIAGKADEVVEALRKRGRGLLDRQKSSAAEELTSFADVMHDAAKKFEEKQEPGVGQFVNKAADYVQDISSALREKDMTQMLHEGERLIRLKPAVSLGVTALMGFAIGRFLRASGTRIAEDTKPRPGPSADLNIGAEGQIQPEAGHGTY